jgi:hypothetical protein
MRRRPLIILLIGCALFAAAVILLWPAGREPSYQGKTLTEWREIYEAHLVNERAPAESPECRQAVQAVRAMSKDVVPYALKLMRGYRHKGGLLTAFERMGLHKYYYPPLRRAWHALGGDVDLEAGREPAVQCFQMLGPEGQAAIPELSRMLADPKESLLTYYAACALAGIGKAGLAVLMAAVDDPHPRRWQARFNLVEAIGYTDPRDEAAKVAVPFLVKCLSDTEVGGVAAQSLGHLAVEPGLAVPALANSIHGTNNQLRWFAAQALGEFGPRARAAVQALTEALTDSDLFLRDRATNSLRKIAPEMLEGGTGQPAGSSKQEN